MRQLIVLIDPLINENEHSWELHFASMLQGYIEAKNLDQEWTVTQINDLSLIKDWFENKLITKRDKVIIPNSWTYMPVYVRHWAELYNVKLEIIGMWSRGCYLNTDPIYRPLADRNWRKVHERASFRCMNKSFFISEFHKEQFRIYVSKRVFPERLNICPFPLDYLELELSKYREDYYKQDIIVFPWAKYTRFHESIIYDFIRVFKNIQVIFAQEHAPMPRHQLLIQMARSKVILLPYESVNIGQDIYECYLLGCIPLIPDLPGFEEMVPKEFRYNPEWTLNIFKYSEYAPYLIQTIEDLCKNYSTYLPLIEEYKEHVSEKFFNSEKIMNQIFG